MMAAPIITELKTPIRGGAGKTTKARQGLVLFMDIPKFARGFSIPG
jgi:hypothetical protein